MRVVFDTNVVVSAILRDRLPEKVSLFVIGRPDFEWVASAEILAEYRNVLARPKFGLPKLILELWDQRFRSAIAQWPVEINISFPRDVTGAKFLACAIATKANFLVTGDRDFTEAIQIDPTKIISVSQFHTLVVQPLN